MRREGPTLLGWGAVAAVYTFAEPWVHDPANAIVAAAMFACLFAVVLTCAFAVARHADHVAERLGEPHGTLVLTLSVIVIEVSLITAGMLTGAADPTLARNTMFAVIMIALNGLVGLAILWGGLRHGQQALNLQGGRAFLAVLVPLIGLSLVLPNFTTTTKGPTFSGFQATILAIAAVGLYAVFLTIQTVRHRQYFVEPDTEAPSPNAGHEQVSPVPGVWLHTVLLLLALGPVVLLAEELSTLIDFGTDRLGAPTTLGGVLIAALVLAPEGMTALRAALANHMQRAANLCLGAALSTIALTLPTVLLVGSITGQQVLLGLPPELTVLLAITLLLSMMTFGSTATNVLQGAVHLVLFFVYLALLIQP